VNVFAWMLWGDLCFTISEAVVPRLVPMQMEKLGASNAAIGIVTGSIFSLMNWVLNPIISTTSDRHRSPLGRRMPFMLYTAPAVALFILAFGFSAELGQALHAVSPSLADGLGNLAGRLLPGTSTMTPGAKLTIATIALLMVAFRFFDLFPQCVYYYLFADVIPQKLMGTFICLFRVTSTLATILFHSALLPYAASHPRAIYAGAALLYLITFLILPLFVKEGDYPPPPPRTSRGPRAVVATWAREVFATPFYWGYFLTNAGSKWAFVPLNLFLLVYAQRRLGMDAGQYGHVMGIVLAVQMPLLFLLGPLLDRFHPTRVAIVGFSLMFLAAVASFLLVHDRATFIGCTIAMYVAIAVVHGATSTLGPRLLPRERYGQFSAANAMVGESGMLIFYGLCGLMLDRFGQQSLFLWTGAFSLFGLAMVVILYRSWLARGGDANYTPPPVGA
jgi:MFS family permease